ncbi:adhesion G-protein coupled receptor G1-like [Onychostoma macrolepis]|uniref:adhesion G-protein coupled receptor G1-like n=1 Tax=Onychostoma macrolepis TaxID=369639 RepID=UPI00272AB470|nr:adhesion G-protein coupled receptor G1-like [Onychostoma macrolepis]
MPLSLEIMSRQKLILLWLMIICCAMRETTCSEKLIIQVSSTDQCFWNSSSSTVPDINPTLNCQLAGNTGNFQANIKLSISSQGQCRSYSFSIIKHGAEYNIRMNETAEGIKLCFLRNGHTVSCQIQQISCNTTGSNHLDFSLCKCLILPDILAGCSQTPHLDLKKSCANATYNNSNICEGSRYALNIKQCEWICVKCDNTTDEESTADSSENIAATGFTPYTATHNPTTEHNLKPSEATPSPITVENGYTDPSKASKALDNLESQMEEMEKSNKSNAMIVTENGAGFLYVQAKNTETKDINICYSSDHATVVESQSDLNTSCSWLAKISKEAFDKSRLQNNGSAFVGVLRFKNLRKKDETNNQTFLNNEFYGITMRAKISNLTDNIDMSFTLNDKVSNVSCVSWDGKVELNWTTSGCETERINNTIKCSCSHLTFFAVLMSPPDANVTAQDLESLTYITYIGCGISMFFLAIALFMHFLLRKAKSNQATKILMNMFVALFLLNVSFLSNESVANTEDNAACVFIALLLHYSMLASFTWFFIQALHMYLWLLRQNVTITNYTRKITVLGWETWLTESSPNTAYLVPGYKVFRKDQQFGKGGGLLMYVKDCIKSFPAPIVITIASVGEYKTVIIKTTSEKISRMCWITNPYIHYTVNIGYYALVFIFTTGIFITILTRIVQVRRLRATDGKRKTFRKQLMMVLSLFLLFGLTWSVAFFSYGPMLIPSYYIFTVLNSFQGFFLFLYYYHIHNDVAGHFSDDPKSSGSTTTMVPPNTNGLENVYN